VTETLARPQRRAKPTPDPVPSLVPVAALGAGSAAALGLLTVSVLVLLVWFSSAGSGASALEAVRTAAAAWLLAHRVPMTLPHGTLALPPLGLSVLPVLLLVRSGGWVARTAQVQTRGRAVQGILAIAASYSVLLGLVAGAAAGTAVPSTVGALFVGWLMGAVAGGIGLLRAAGLLGPLWRALPLWLSALLAGVGASVAALLAGGALVVGGSLLFHLDRTVHLTQALNAGAAGGAALCLVGLVYVPTAAVWGAAYALGPGFAVGVGTSVGPFATHVGAVPALPLLGGLPGNGSGATLGALALVIPFVAGIAGGAVIARRGDWDTPEHAALWALLLGPAAGVGCGLLAWVAGGPAGPGRFATVGPSPWAVGLTVSVEFAIAGAVGAWEARRRLGT